MTKPVPPSSSLQPDFGHNAYAYIAILLPDGRPVLRNEGWFFDENLSNVLKEMSLWLEEMSKKEEWNRPLIEVANIKE